MPIENAIVAFGHLTGTPPLRIRILMVLGDELQPGLSMKAVLWAGGHDGLWLMETGDKNGVTYLEVAKDCLLALHGAVMKELTEKIQGGTEE